MIKFLKNGYVKMDREEYDRYEAITRPHTFDNFIFHDAFYYLESDPKKNNYNEFQEKCFNRAKNFLLLDKTTIFSKNKKWIVLKRFDKQKGMFYYKNNKTKYKQLNKCEYLKFNFKHYIFANDLRYYMMHCKFPATIDESAKIIKTVKLAYSGVDDLIKKYQIDKRITFQEEIRIMKEKQL